MGQLAPVSDILCVATGNDPATLTDAPCYLTGEEHGDSRPLGIEYRKKHTRLTGCAFPHRILNGIVQAIKHRPFIHGIKVLHKIAG